MQCIIIKNPASKKLKYFGAEDWIYTRDDAVVFNNYVDAVRVIKGLHCKTATWVSA